MKYVKHEAGGFWDIFAGTSGVVTAGGSLALSAMVDAVKTAPKVALAVPAMAGAALGYASSALTSPGPGQLKALEGRIVNANLDEMIQENRRKEAVVNRRRQGERAAHGS